MWKTSTPTLWPPTGTYSATTVVTASTVTSGAVIHYTTTGADPTLADPAVAPGGTVTVAQSLTLKAAAWAPGYAGSHVVAATYTMVVPAPTLSPPGGTFEGTVTVSLSSPIAGTTIRYTIDGSSPTASSPVYATPITLTTRTTLQARAFRAGWGESGAAVETYAFADHIAPVVTVSYTPAPNTAGWNTTPVTVSFTCTDENSGVADCPEPIVFETEGAGQTMTVTATDLGGNQASRSVAVNIDKTPASVTLSAPTNGSTVTTTAVSVSATVVDTLSGVQGATCNGVAATVSEGALLCSVTLGKGLNTIVVHALDAAGNSASASARVTRAGTVSAITVVPSRYTLATGETVPLKAVDDFGQPVTGLTWTSDNTTIATVDVEGVVTAAGAGEATITASTGSLSTPVTVTVLAAGPLPVGTTRWSVDPLSGYHTIGILGIGPLDDSTSFVAVEGALNGSGSVMRGFNTAGEQTYFASPPLAPGEQVYPAMGDSDGGVLFFGNSSLVYMNPRAGTSSWRYTIPANWALRGSAQGPDGTFFITLGHVERVQGFTITTEASIIGIDQQTGTVKFNIPTPLSRYRRSQCGNYIGWDLRFADIVGPVVDTNGTADLTILVEDAVELLKPPANGNCALDTLTNNAQALLYRVSSSGAYATTVLHQYVGEPIRLGGIANALPDGQGGVLANWGCFGTGSDCSGGRARYVGPTTMSDEYSLTATPYISGSNQVGYAWNGAGTVAFDVTNGHTLWNAAGFPLVAVNGGSLAAVSLVDGSMSIFSTGGNLVASGLPRIGPVDTIGDLWIGNANGALSALVGLDVSLDVTAGSPLLQGGNRGRQNAPVRPYPTADAAAIAVLQQNVPVAQKDRQELGGSICQVSSNRYFPTVPASSRDEGTVIPSLCSATVATVGEYHTHVGPQPMDQPSGGDILRSYQLGLVGYIGVSFDVTDNQPVNCAPQGRGNIWKFKMDTSVPFNSQQPAYAISPVVIACTPTGR